MLLLEETPYLPCFSSHRNTWVDLLPPQKELSSTPKRLRGRPPTPRHDELVRIMGPGGAPATGSVPVGCGRVHPICHGGPVGIVAIKIGTGTSLWFQQFGCLLVLTSATLVVTSALLLVTRSYFVTSSKALVTTSVALVTTIACGSSSGVLFISGSCGVQPGKSKSAVWAIAQHLPPAGLWYRTRFETSGSHLHHPEAKREPS